MSQGASFFTQDYVLLPSFRLLARLAFLPRCGKNHKNSCYFSPIPCKTAVDGFSALHKYSKTVVDDFSTVNKCLETAVDGLPSRNKCQKTTVDGFSALQKCPKTVVDGFPTFNKHPKTAVDAFSALQKCPKTVVDSLSALKKYSKTVVDGFSALQKCLETTVDGFSAVNKCLETTVDGFSQYCAGHIRHGRSRDLLNDLRLAIEPVEIATRERPPRLRRCIAGSARLSRTDKSSHKKYKEESL